MKPDKIIHAKGRTKMWFFCGYPKALGGYYTQKRKDATCLNCKLGIDQFDRKIGRSYMNDERGGN